MVLDINGVRSAFDALPVGPDSILQRVITEGRLRYSGEGETPDLVDEFSARLICSAVGSGSDEAILIVFPDESERRTPLLFAMTLIVDGLAQIDARAVRGRILYLSNHAGIRTQLSSVRLGSVRLDGVFSQEYGRGRGDELKTLAWLGGVHLPSVLCICAPADPVTLLRQHRPKWVAVDCGESHEIAWLPAMLAEARLLGIPVVGWTARPFSGTVSQWLAAGGGVLRWPRQKRGARKRIVALEQLSTDALEAEVIPRVLMGEQVLEVSRGFAAATEALLMARKFQVGRLATDALMVGWKYLRAMESVPVPLEVYERDASSYWGLRRLSDLRDTFSRFVEAVQPVSRDLFRTLQSAADAFSRVHQRLLADSPLWFGLANLCVDSGPRQIVFASKSRRQMFSFSLLARFNISEDDLRELGVTLLYIADAAEDDIGEGYRSAPQPTAISFPLLVGMPSRFAEKHLDGLFEPGHLEVILWPHQELMLDHRVRHLSAQLNFKSQKLRRFLPTLEGSGEPDPEGTCGERAALRIARARHTMAGALGEELRQKASAEKLWNRPDTSEIVESLFGPVLPSEDEEDYRPASFLDDATAVDQVHGTSESVWVQEGLELSLEGGYRVLFPTDEAVNVILRVAGGAELEQRYVRSLRKGDEILFIQGQRRQNLYELLVSRVHRDPSIGQYLALVRRWQDDFASAFAEAESLGRASVESLLQEIQAKGSRLTSPLTIRAWSRRLVLAPNDPEDLRRIGEALSLGFVRTYYKQIDSAGKRLKGLHINLSVRLNRWLSSSSVGTVAVSSADEVIDAELGLTVEDFRHSLLRTRILEVTQRRGPFYRPHLGRLEGGTI